MKEKNKKIVIGLLSFVGIILLCFLCYFASVAATDKSGDTYSKNNTNESTENITYRAQEESNNVSEDEKKDFTDINVDKYIELYNSSEKSVVLFSRPTCGYCQIAEPILHNIAYKYDLNIYHVNTDEMNEDDYKKLSDTDQIFEQLGTPMLAVVSEGKILNTVDGLTDTEHYVDFLKENGFINE